MPKFQDISTKIFDILLELGEDQCRVLFGYADDFTKWLKEHEVEDEVSVF
jgi:hypothetical protein